MTWRYAALCAALLSCGIAVMAAQGNGDGSKADGEPSLAIFGAGSAARRDNGPPQDITPNHRALALRFGLFDRFFVNAEVSADGHNWSMAAYATDYLQKTVQANFVKPVPVYIVYFSAAALNDGRIVDYKDLYGRDAKATAALVKRDLPAGCDLVDLGPHRLRGLTRPERIHALKGAGISAPLPVSTREWIASDSIAALPEKAAATPLDTAIAKLAPSAKKIARVESPPPAMHLFLSLSD